MSTNFFYPTETLKSLRIFASLYLAEELTISGKEGTESLDKVPNFDNILFEKKCGPV
jgi:hypothetical protein